MAAACAAERVDEASPPQPSVPISVTELVARSTDTATVRGFLHVDEGQARLCDAILESYPPQCGEPSITLVDLNVDAIAGTTTAGGITWKERVVLTVQRVDADVFHAVGTTG